MVELYFVGFSETEAIDNGPVTFRSAQNAVVFNRGLSVYRVRVFPCDIEEIKVH